MTAPAPAELDLAFTWTLRDYVQAQRAILLSRELVVVLMVAIPAILLIVMAVGIYLRTQSLDVGFDPQVLESVAITVLPMVALVEWVMLSGWFNVSGRRQRRTDRNLQFPIHHVFHQYGMTVKGKASQLTLGWKSIPRIVETAEFVLFYSSGKAAYFLPKRDIAPSDLDALRGFILAHRGDVANLKEQQ